MRTSWHRSAGVARKLLWAYVVFFALLSVGFSAAQNPVVTYHADPTRSGLYGMEFLLTPSNVNSTQFGKLFSYTVDGLVVGQPLYVPNVSLPGLGTHNVIYVATQHDSVFAFDADNPGSGSPLWQVSFINPSEGVTTVPIAEQGCFETGFTEIGIMGTPVISANGILYVVAKTKEVSGSTTNYVFRLHALDITTGLEQYGAPIVISATMNAPNGNVVSFPMPKQYQRPALLLQNDMVFVGFGSNGCDYNAHGWLFAFDSGIASGLVQQLGVYNTSLNQTYGGSLWMSGNGPAGDGAGNVYLATANGAFDFSTGGPDLGDSILKFNYSSGALNLEDYFTPYDQNNMYENDLDLGSGGVLLLPPQPGPNPNLLVESGKTGTIYLVNLTDLGGYNSSTNNCVQFIPYTLGQVYSTPTYWNNMVYFAGDNDMIKGFALSNGLLTTSPAVTSARQYSGGVPVISANGSTNGVLWVIFNPNSPTLYAFDGTALGMLYNTGQIPKRDSLGTAAHFAVPIVANGKVYVGSNGSLMVYGLFPFLAAVGGNNQNGAVGTQLPTALSVQALNSLGQGVAGVVVTFSDGNAGGSFSNPTATTDSTGTATTNYTLPTRAQTVTITTTASGYIKGTFTEVASPGPATALVNVSGVNQSGTVGTQLPSPIVVKLKDQYGNGVIGASVAFTDNSAGGSFSANPVTTNSTGSATVYYTLPTKAKAILIVASYAALQSKIAEKSVAGSATSMKLLSGNKQTGPPSTPLPLPLVVQALDQYGNVVSGVSVSFSDGSAGGTFSANPVTTGSNGQASVNYTTPPQAGAVTITASASNVNTVTFQENVN